MDNFERWQRMLNSVGTTPKIWKVFEEMKQEIIKLEEKLNKQTQDNHCVMCGDSAKKFISDGYYCDDCCE